MESRQTVYKTHILLTQGQQMCKEVMVYLEVSCRVFHNKFSKVSKDLNTKINLRFKITFILLIRYKYRFLNVKYFTTGTLK